MYIFDFDLSTVDLKLCFGNVSDAFNKGFYYFIKNKLLSARHLLLFFLKIK